MRNLILMLGCASALTLGCSNVANRSSCKSLLQAARFGPLMLAVPLKKRS